MQNMGFSPLLRRLVYRTLSLPQASQQVLGLGLNRSESSRGRFRPNFLLLSEEEKAKRTCNMRALACMSWRTLQFARRPTEKGCRKVQRLPTAHLLPIVARTGIRHFR
jgi:hypothetical protein